METRYLRCNGLLVHPDYAAVLHREGLDSLEALLEAESGRTLDKKGLAAWRQRVVLPVGDRRLYLKRYRRPPLGEQLRQRGRGFTSTAQLEWHWLSTLERLGIAAPVRVAFGCRRGALLERSSALLIDEVPGRSMERWVPDQVGAKLADRGDRRAVRDALAALAARLHGAGLVHRDLYLSHVFIDDRPSGGPRLSLIDLQRVRRPRLRRRRWIVKDLAALNYSTPRAAASNAERLRWFKAYRGVTTLTRRDRALIRAIVRKTRRIARHSTRHGLG